MVQRFKYDLTARQLSTLQKALQLFDSQLVGIAIEGKLADKVAHALSSPLVVLLRFQVQVFFVESGDRLHPIDCVTHSWLTLHLFGFVGAFGNFGKIMPIQVNFGFDHHHLRRGEVCFVHIFDADFILP